MNRGASIKKTFPLRLTYYNGLSMKITFKTVKLQKIFDDQKKLVAEFGTPMFKKIRIRMSVLSAATTLAQVPQAKPDRCHQLEGKRRGTFAVDLMHPFRLIFKPKHKPVPTDENGAIDLHGVTSIEIQTVEDYH